MQISRLLSITAAAAEAQVVQQTHTAEEPCCALAAHSFFNQVLGN